MKMLRNILLATVLLLLITGAAYAQIPRVIAYQGVLLDPNKQPKPDGNYVFEFRFFDVPSGGSPLWESGPVNPAIRVVNGCFSTMLGDRSVMKKLEDTLSFANGYFLEIEVGGVKLPRVKLTPVPYAFYSFAASYADKAAYADRAGGSLRADTAIFADSTRAAYIADTAKRAATAKYADTAQFARSGNDSNGTPDSVRAAYIADTAKRAATAKHAVNADTSRFAHNADTSRFAHNADTSRFAHNANHAVHADTALFAHNGVPIGTIIAYYGHVNDSIDNTGWLLCNGQPVSAGQPGVPRYLDYRVRIGSATPDLRAMFLRGANAGRTDAFADPNVNTSGPTGRFLNTFGHPGDVTAGGQKIGSRQADTLGTHAHGIHAESYSTSGATVGDYLNQLAAGHNVGGGNPTGVDVTNENGAAETRPNNVYVNWLIKAW